MLPWQISWLTQSWTVLAPTDLPHPDYQFILINILSYNLSIPNLLSILICYIQSFIIYSILFYLISYPILYCMSWPILPTWYPTVPCLILFFLKFYPVLSCRRLHPFLYNYVLSYPVAYYSTLSQSMSYSVLSHSVLFYSILFYSILFYSILYPIHSIP